MISAYIGRSRKVIPRSEAMPMILICKLIICFIEVFTSHLNLLPSSFKPIPSFFLHASSSAHSIFSSLFPICLHIGILDGTIVTDEVIFTEEERATLKHTVRVTAGYLRTLCRTYKMQTDITGVGPKVLSSTFPGKRVDERHVHTCVPGKLKSRVLNL